MNSTPNEPVAGDRVARDDPELHAPATARTSDVDTRCQVRPARSEGSAEWSSTLDDPSIREGDHGYRSFYIEDTVFARFRAAVFWTARRHDATHGPENMSAGVEAYMADVAAALERQYNDGAVFPPTPAQLRSHRRRDAKRRAV